MTDLIVVNREGDFAASNDGGTTWLLTNNTTAPAGQRFGGERVADVEIAPTSSTSSTSCRSASSSGRTAVAPGQALVGSGAGAFAATVRASSATSCTTNYRYLPGLFRTHGPGW